MNPTIRLAALAALSLAACTADKGPDQEGEPIEVTLGTFTTSAWSPAADCEDDGYSSETGPSGFSLASTEILGGDYVEFSAEYEEEFGSQIDWLYFEWGDSSPLTSTLWVAGTNSSPEEEECFFRRVEATLETDADSATLVGRVFEGAGPEDEDGFCSTDDAEALGDDAVCGEFTLEGALSAE